MRIKTQLSGNVVVPYNSHFIQIFIFNIRELIFTSNKTDIIFYKSIKLQDFTLYNTDMK